MSKVSDFLEGEILDSFDKLQELEFGSEEHNRAVDDICKMSNVYLNSEKLEKESDDKEIRREIDSNNRKEDLMWKIAETGAGLIFEGLVVICAMSWNNKQINKAYEFERNGTIRTDVGRQTNRFRPMKISRFF